MVPSSYCIRNGHIMWLFYLMHCLSSLLDTHFFQSTRVIIPSWKKMASSSRTNASAIYHQLFWKYVSHSKIAQQKDVCVWVGSFLVTAENIVVAV